MPTARTDTSPHVSRRSYGGHVNLGFRYESEMTHLAAAAAPWWWPRGLQHDFVAAEIVGPDAVADLVGIRFDQRRLAAREAEGISPVIDALALHALQACCGRVMSTTELADACRVTPSGMRRALAIAVEANAMVRQGRGRYARHPAWAPVGARMVAVELKLENWRAAFCQAEAYSRWSNPGAGATVPVCAPTATARSPDLMPAPTPGRDAGSHIRGPAGEALDRRGRWWPVRAPTPPPHHEGS